MSQLGNACPVRHGSIQGISGIVAPLTDGVTYFYDCAAQERYPLDECPPVVTQGAVAPQMVPEVLRRMREAKIVHLR